MCGEASLLTLLQRGVPHLGLSQERQPALVFASFSHFSSFFLTQGPDPAPGRNRVNTQKQHESPVASPYIRPEARSEFARGWGKNVKLQKTIQKCASGMSFSDLFKGSRPPEDSRNFARGLLKKTQKIGKTLSSSTETLSLLKNYVF